MRASKSGRSKVSYRAVFASGRSSAIVPSSPPGASVEEEGPAEHPATPASVSAIAVVNLVDVHGKAVKIDLRELLDLKENQTVTIRGKAKLLAGSLLQIDADGIYVKPPASVARSKANAVESR